MKTKTKQTIEEIRKELLKNNLPYISDNTIIEISLENELKKLRGLI